MNDEAGKAGGDYAEEDNEGDISSDSRAEPAYGYGEVDEGARSSLSGHFYPNPPVF